MTDEPDDHTGAVAHGDGPDVLPPAPEPQPEPPTLSLPIMNAPRLEAPVLPPPPTFTPPPERDITAGIPRPATGAAPAARRRAPALPWIVAALGVAAAVVFAVLWVGAKGDLDDAHAELALASRGDEISDEVALQLGRAFAPQADPPLDDAEATCLGRAFVNRVGLGTLMEIGIAENPDGAVTNEIAQAALDVAEGCGVDVSRLGG